MVQMDQWNGFKGRLWKEEINVRDFIQNNYKPYDGDESFLEGPTEATNKLWGRLQELQKEERAKGGVLDMETEVVAGLTAYGPGYIDESMKDLEQIVGLQTDKPLKRAFMPYGGIKMAEESCKNYGYEPNPELHKIFTEYHKTHNQGVFDAYTPEMRKARHSHIITGLPDTYGRGRIVGDYRRVALYGIDFLMEEKKKDHANCGCGTMTDDVIRLREELSDQYKALAGMKKMAESYGYDISKPATNAKEACQWLYFGYLAAIKTQNGAAMSLGRTSTFIDCFAQRDLANGTFTEEQIQEFVDHSWFTYSNEGKDTKDLGLYPFDGETVPHFELPKGSVGTKTKFSWLGGDGKYSWIKTPKWKGHTMEVGPLARVVVGYALGKEVYKEPVDALLKEMNLPLEAVFSTLGRTAARAIDAVVAADLMVKYVDDLTANIKGGDEVAANMEKWDPSTWPKECKGVGLCEAPRGALSHWCVIKDGKIANWQAVVPTTWNACPRDANGQHGAFEASLLGTPIIDPKKPLEILRTIHSFDPCLACSSHLFDPEGKEITKVVSE